MPLDLDDIIDAAYDVLENDTTDELAQYADDLADLS